MFAWKADVVNERIKKERMRRVTQMSSKGNEKGLFENLGLDIFGEHFILLNANHGKLVY